jgi:hypothetical protein
MTDSGRNQTGSLRASEARNRTFGQQALTSGKTHMQTLRAGSLLPETRRSFMCA